MGHDLLGMSVEGIGVWIGTLFVIITCLVLLKMESRDRRRRIYEKVEKLHSDLQDFKERFIVIPPMPEDPSPTEIQFIIAKQESGLPLTNRQKEILKKVDKKDGKK